MEIIAFYGSPRRDGNTALLLREAIRGVEAEGFPVRGFHLNTMKIRPCQNCGGCNETGICVVKDDMEEVSAALRAAARIILASPIFFSGVSAQTKAMIDRCQAIWSEKYFLKKPIPAGPHGRKGLFITVGGMRMAKHAECVDSTATAFFRTLNVSEHQTLVYQGIDAKGAILQHPSAMPEVFEAGRALVRI